MIRYAWALFLSSAAVQATAQVPPPPPPAGQREVVAKLLDAFERKDAAAYGDLLSDDLVVHEDGAILARSRAEWMRRFAPRLAATGVIFKLSPGFQSSGRLLVIEYFSSVGSWGTPGAADCCKSYDAVSYRIKNGKIEQIQRLTGGPDKVLP